jgi:hypothetical protein
MSDAVPWRLSLPTYENNFSFIKLTTKLISQIYMVPSKLPTCSNTSNLSLYLIYSYALDEEELSPKTRSKSNFKPFNLHPNQTKINQLTTLN